MPSLLDYLVRMPMFSPLRVAGWSLLTRTLAKKHLAIVPDGNEPERREVYSLIRKVRQEAAMVQLDVEAAAIYAAVRQTAKIPGAIAEVGVFRGGSARVICAAKDQRALHLFDTFVGLPQPGTADHKFQAGSFRASLEDVERYLAGFGGITFHPGVFPGSAAGLEADRFSFVHLDVDLHDSTRDCLEWFYPRLSRGAVLISHDYLNTEGVRRAFDQFIADKPECLVELAGTQVALVKL